VSLECISICQYVETTKSRSWAVTVDLRQNKRYRLKAVVTFSWLQADGGAMRGEGYTRDISPSGVFVVTGDQLPSGTAVKLEVALPSLQGKSSGASLRTQGHVVRSEETGFAAAADMGFRMKFPETHSVEDSFSFVKSRGNGKCEANGEEKGAEKAAGIRARSASRFWM